MAVIVTVTRPAVVIPPPTGVSIALDTYDAQVLRTMLGGLTRDQRRKATKSNGGTQSDADRARHLVKELIDLLDANGFNRLGQGPSAVPAVPMAEDEEEDFDDSMDDDDGV